MVIFIVVTEDGLWSKKRTRSVKLLTYGYETIWGTNTHKLRLISQIGDPDSLGTGLVSSLT